MTDDRAPHRHSSQERRTKSDDMSVEESLAALIALAILIGGGAVYGLVLLVHFVITHWPF